jgi:hypothetical protein
MRYGNPALTLEHSMERFKVKETVFPDRLIPFAVDPGGDYYCFSVCPDEVGAIYLFHMDHYGEPEGAAEYLAPSLGEFLSKLRPKGEQ